MNSFPFNLIFKEDGGFRWPMMLLIAVIFFAISIAISEFIYGDWRCSFAECRINK